MRRPLLMLAVFAPLAFLSVGSPPAPAQAPKKDEPKKPGIDRTKAGKARLLKAFGGSEEGEEAVMLGLAWLTQQQKQDGGWDFDGTRRADTAPAAGLAVLAFLGAGQSHKDGRYKQTVQAGLDWLVNTLDTSNGPKSGHFKGAPDMYGQGIATLALCEAYGMTQDPALKGPAQMAINYVQRAQARNGSWGYQPGNVGDTSIVGWQVQALHAGQLGGLEVDEKVIKKAIEFLDHAGAGRYKPIYGYQNSAGADHATNRTAIGLLCRYYIDGWRRENPGFAEGSQGLMKRTPLATFTGVQFDMYYYYYATQVVRFFGGEEWETWNKGAAGPDGVRDGGMPDWLIKLQVRTPTNRGSWDPDRTWIGRDCGRLGTTCLCLLTLEVYYRYTPEDDPQNAAKKP